jgi:hypothetical protein
MKPRHWVLIVILVLFGGCTYKFLTGLRTDVYHGRVVDEATEAPLAGAVVAVIWSRVPLVSIEGGPKFFLNAQETVVDSEGKFFLRVSSGLDWNPFTGRVDQPWVVVYQPGYEPMMPGTLGRQGFDTIDGLVALMKSGGTVKLRKLRTGEVAKYTDRRVLGTSDTPFDRLPNLLRAVNTQNKMAGIPSYTINSSPKRENTQ